MVCVLQSFGIELVMTVAQTQPPAEGPTTKLCPCRWRHLMTYAQIKQREPHRKILKSPYPKPVAGRLSTYRQDGGHMFDVGHVFLNYEVKRNQPFDPNAGEPCSQIWQDPPPLDVVVANLIEVARRWETQEATGKVTTRQQIVVCHLAALDTMRSRSHAMQNMVQHSLCLVKFLVASLQLHLPSFFPNADRI